MIRPTEMGFCGSNSDEGVFILSSPEDTLRNDVKTGWLVELHCFTSTRAFDLFNGTSKPSVDMAVRPTPNKVEGDCCTSLQIRMIVNKTGTTNKHNVTFLGLALFLSPNRVRILLELIVLSV